MPTKTSRSVVIIEVSVEYPYSETEILKKNGFSVTHLADISELSSLLKTSSTIDLILYEIRLDDGCDPTNLEQVLGEVEIPVMFISASTDPDIFSRYKEFECYGYIQRGCGVGILLASINTAFHLFKTKQLYAIKERNLTESEERSRELMNALPAAVLLHPLQKEGFAEFVSVNKWACERYGYSATEFLTLRANDITIIPDGNKKGQRGNRNKLLEEGRLIFESTHVTKSGDLFPVEINSKIIQIQGEPMILSVVHDISEKKSNRLAILESEDNFRQLFEESPISLWEEDFSAVVLYLNQLKADGVTDFRKYFDQNISELEKIGEKLLILDVNKASIELFKAGDKENLMANLVKTISDQSFEVLKEELIALAKGDKDYSTETELMTFDGELLHVMLNLKIGYNHQEGDQPDHVWGIVSMQDMTASKKAELALQEREHNYRQLFEESPISLWEEDFGPILAYIDHLKQNGVTDFRTFLDENPEEVTLMSSKLLVLDVNKTSVKLLKAKSKEDLMSSLDKTFTKRTIEEFKDEIISLADGNMEYNTEGEVQTLDGSNILDVLINVTVGLDNVESEGDGYQRGIVSLIDISDRKRMERDLQLAKDYSGNLMATANTVIVTLDLDANITSFNKYAEQLTGYEQAEVIGKNWFELFVTEEGQKTIPVVFRDALKQMPDVAEYENPILIRDGSERYFHWNNNVIYDPDGAIAGLLSIGNDITDRKQVEIEKEKDQAFMQAVIDAMPESLMVINPDFTIALANRSVTENSLGRGPVCEGLTCHLVSHGSHQPCGESDHSCPLQEVLETKKVVKICHLHRDKSGSDFPIEIIAAPIFNDKGDVIQVVESSRDISEREDLAQALIASEERYRTFFENNDAIIMMINPENGIIIFANNAALDFYRYTRENLVGMHITKINVLPPAEIKDRMRRAKLTNQNYFLFKHRLANGSIRDVELYQSTLTLDSKEVFSIIVHDITDRLMAEEARKSLERQVQHAQKLESLGVLAGGIAHDFNNILTSILGNADLALSELSPLSPARDNLMEIEKASRRAAELAKQMLAYSGKGRFVVEPIRVGELVFEMAHMLDVSISKKAILKYNFAENLPTFDGDATQMRQIIMNLITNASDAIGDASGVIALSTGAMECDRAYLDSGNNVLQTTQEERLEEGVYIYIEVSDTGCGMDDETISKIFDPFFTTKFTGRGLGMAAVLGIVRGHQGAIQIQSELGKGSTFKVLFPATGPPEDHIEAPNENRPSAEKWSASGTILIVDDEKSVRAVGKRMLEKYGFTVKTAQNGV